MDIKDYIQQKKDLYNNFISFIENKESNDDFDSLIIKIRQNTYNKDEMHHFLNLLINIADNYHFYTGFFDKIVHILDHFKDDLNKDFSIYELFNIFKSNKRILYFLFKKEIIIFDEDICQIIEEFELNKNKYRDFFLPEIKNLKKNDEKEAIERTIQSYSNYEEKRQIGENDSYVCLLIRQDSINEFISYTYKTNLSLSSEIENSIFETNSFLITNKPTLIEYSAFFGSIKIFRYLHMNNAPKTPMLWLYAIHSRSSELIYLLEEYGIKPPKNKYTSCLIQAIKCHHNEIAYYFEDNFFNEQELKMISEVIFKYSLYYNNYLFLSDDFDTKYSFFYFCKFKYNDIVNHILKSKENDIKSKINKIYIYIFLMNCQLNRQLNKMK